VVLVEVDKVWTCFLDLISYSDSHLFLVVLFLFNEHIPFLFFFCVVVAGKQVHVFFSRKDKSFVLTSVMISFSKVRVYQLQTVLRAYISGRPYLVEFEDKYLNVFENLGKLQLNSGDVLSLEDNTMDNPLYIRAEQGKDLFFLFICE
jgi:hypothetical protein